MDIKGESVLYGGGGRIFLAKFGGFKCLFLVLRSGFILRAPIYDCDG